jgi:hypothetical protein
VLLHTLAVPQQPAMWKIRQRYDSSHHEQVRAELFTREILVCSQTGRPNGWSLTTRAGRDWTPSHENKVTIEPYLYGNLLAAPGSTSLRHFLVVDSEVSVQSKRQAHTLCLGRYRKHRRAVSFNLKTPIFGVSNTYHSEHHRDEDIHMIRLTISFSQ